MQHENYDSSASGYVTDSFEGISRLFTDVEVLATSEVNIVAKAKRYGRWWLLKGLRKEVADETGYQQRLRKELEILTALQYPNIVTAVGLEEVDGFGPCIVMEYVDGVTLKEWLAEKPSRRMRLRVMLEIADAVAYIHTKGIVHRDLKPTNIIVTGNGRHVKLIDFGLADTDSHAILKQPAGTPDYMSPEQRQTAVADGRNDIYSMGVIMQQMDLGWRYRYIIKRCTLPIDRRYQQVEELQQAIVSTEGRIKSLITWLGGLLIMLLLLLIGLQMQRSKEQNERLEQLKATYQQEQREQRQQIRQLTDSTMVLGNYNQQLREKEAAIVAKRRKVQDAIVKGKVIIDRTMRQTNIDQHLDTLTNMLYMWSDFSYRSQSGERAIERYMQQINASFCEAEKDEIRSALAQHNSDIVTQWRNKIVNLCK